uniref:hypothetical protein n=1 Tax=Anaerobutyricum hallii TaxID=39488 RepID=UPI003FF11DE7
MESETKTLETRFDDSQEALYEIGLELEELMMALNELTNDYDTNLAFNLPDLKKYAAGDAENRTGELAYRFLYDHKRILWFIRTAKMYCEEAERICKGAMA